MTVLKKDTQLFTISKDRTVKGSSLVRVLGWIQDIASEILVDMQSPNVFLKVSL